MKKLLITLLIIVLLFCGIYFLTGLYIIQPIGALPEGVTIWYFRPGLNLPFISSADGFLLKNTGGVSLLTRALATGKLLEQITPRKIMKLPYFERLYLVSTDGVTFDR